MTVCGGALDTSSSAAMKSIWIYQIYSINIGLSRLQHHIHLNGAEYSVVSLISVGGGCIIGSGGREIR